MKNTILSFTLITALFVLISCSNKSYTENPGKVMSAKFIRQIKLENKLREISGLALSKEGKLFAHNDEEGIVFQIDTKTGKTIKSFSIGEKMVKADFEGIAIAENKFFLVTSNGYLYSFDEGENNKTVNFIKYKTNLSKRENIEGLCFDEKTNSLLLACKGPSPGYSKHKRLIYSFNLKSFELDDKPRFIINLKELKKNYGINNFSTSGISLDKKTGEFYLLSAHEKALLILSDTGSIISAQRLSSEIHKQPEGIEITGNGLLYISDEGRYSKGFITVYNLKEITE